MTVAYSSGETAAGSRPSGGPQSVVTLGDAVPVLGVGALDFASGFEQAAACWCRRVVAVKSAGFGLGRSVASDGARWLGRAQGLPGCRQARIQRSRHLILAHLDCVPVTMGASLKRACQRLDLLDAVVRQWSSLGLTAPIGLYHRVGRKTVGAWPHRVVEDRAHQLSMLTDRPRCHLIAVTPEVAGSSPVAPVVIITCKLRRSCRIAQRSVSSGQPSRATVEHRVRPTFGWSGRRSQSHSSANEALCRDPLPYVPHTDCSPTRAIRGCGWADRVRRASAPGLWARLPWRSRWIQPLTRTPAPAS